MREIKGFPDFDLVVLVNEETIDLHKDYKVQYDWNINMFYIIDKLGREHFIPKENILYFTYAEKLLK
jgi:hypothetical protein